MNGNKAVVVKATLYFLIAVLPVLGERLASMTVVDGRNIATTIISSLLAGCIALRAYIDGSYQRNLDENKNDPKL